MDTVGGTIEDPAREGSAAAPAVGTVTMLLEGAVGVPRSRGDV
jgi:hypothetical protein